MEITSRKKKVQEISIATAWTHKKMSTTTMQIPTKSEKM